MAYAGDVGCRECWGLLESDPRAQLIDVRTSAEWNFVGIPLLEPLGREAILIEWQSYPSMSVNPAFVEMLQGRLTVLDVARDTPLLFLCRSGARSASAAAAATAAGFARAYNVAGGFEGTRDPSGHRATVSGWKFEGLPWVQG